MSGQGQKRLQKELMKLQKNPEVDTTITILNDNIFKWEVTIIAPKKTPYEGGYFRYNFEFPEEYPFHPPKVKSLQPVYHPSYDNEGAICIDILRKDEWSPMSGVREILIALTQLFKDQNSDHPLSEEIAEVYKKNKTQFTKNAKEWTKKHAVKK